MPGNQAYQDAERALDSGLYAEALDGYNLFLQEAYDDPFVDDALFKIGRLYRLTGRDDDAIAVFSRLENTSLRREISLTSLCLVTTQ